jgi:heme ABC exporter ATP-binding subunit CcmA
MVTTIITENGQPTSADGAVVHITGVVKSFESRKVLAGIDLDAHKGQSVCLCGLNGAGKSTLLRITAGLLQPDSGSVHVHGHDLHAEPETAKPHLGVIAHKSMVYGELTVLENLLFFARLYGVASPHASVGAMLEDVGLSHFMYDRVSILSRGLLQRLSIARALLHRPSVLLADEPFTGLDSEAAGHLVSVLKEFRDKGGTVIMTTHDIRYGLECCDRVIVLDKARLIFDSVLGEIDADAFQQDYLSYARGSG